MMQTSHHRATDPQRPYVLLPSGCILDLADPQPDSWTDRDLAIGLSRTYRWGGHSKWKRPLSVAQHSLTVLAIREIACFPLNANFALYELLHDAEEGLLGWDAIAPVKAFLGQPFADLCQRLTKAVSIRYELPDLSQDEYRLHKGADITAAASEALYVTSWTREQIRSVLQIQRPPLLLDLLDTGPYAPWEPWPSDYAEERWLAALAHHRGRRLHEVAPIARSIVP